MTHFFFALLLAATMLVPATLRADEPIRTRNSVERVFVNGGRARIKLTAGEYKIRPSADPGKMKVTWRTQHDEDMDRVRVTSEATGREAVLKVNGPMNNFRAEIELPPHTDLDVDMSVGEISIVGIEGSKHVDLNIGEVRIEVGRPEDYRSVRGSLKIGEISARPFKTKKEGFFRDFDWFGTGKYTLDVRLGIGEIKLTGN